jgi:glycine/D-amino acid oxidase-like deaminating enzyme
MTSIWQKTAELPTFPSLEKDIKTDVLIIGGGQAGILTAYKLKEKGVNCIVVEKDRICQKVTGNSTAKITSQHGFCYSKIIKSNGFESAKMYLHANELALREYEKLCKNIPCDFEKKDNFVYTLENMKLIDDELEALWKMGFDAEFQDKLPLPIKPIGAIKFKNQAQFNVLRFVKGIVKDLKVYENTFVKKIDGTSAITEKSKIIHKEVS